MNATDNRATTAPPLTEPTRSRFWPELLLVVIAIIPFQLLHLGPALRDDGAATGFILYDMPYYVANGREIFERGNGLTYPNPYDPTDESPAIYFHWLLWIFGFCTVKLGIDPGALFAAAGVIGSLLMAGMTWLLIKSILPDERWRKTLFLLTMWGGGVLCAAKLLMNVCTGQLPWNELLAFDTHLGFWAFSWGRNSIYPTEAIYHFLAIAAWYFAFHRRYWRSILLAGLLAATHPWSGLEVLGTFTAFLGLRALVRHTQPAWRVAVSATLMLCAFFAYNLWFLNLHESHRAVYDIWHINWSLEPLTLVFAYLPIGYFAFRAISAHLTRTVQIEDSGDDRTTDGAPSLLTEWQSFLLTCFACAFILATHDRFVAHAKQPLHFTRGFVWMPLCLLALPYLQRWMSARPRWNARPTLAATLLLLVACFDNTVFLSNTIQSFAVGNWDVQTMRTTQREVLDWLDQQRLQGVLASSDELVGYLSATYTSVNPFAGHKFNTPDHANRKARMERWLSGKQDAQLEQQIDYVLVKQVEFDREDFGSSWAKAYENDEYVFLAKSQLVAEK